MTEQSKKIETMVSHVYDLNVHELIHKMRIYYEKYCDSSELKSRLDFLEGTLGSIVSSYRKKRKSKSINLEMNHLIMSPNDHLFHVLLAFKLITCDVYKIDEVLSYNLEQFENKYSNYKKKKNFSKLVDHHVYPIVKSHCGGMDELKLEKIMAWIKHERDIERIQKNVKSPIINHVNIPKIVEDKSFASYVKIEENTAKRLCEGLLIYIDSKRNEDLFEAFIEVNYIKTKITLNLDVIEISDLFKKMVEKKIIWVSNKKSLADWISKRFNISNRNGETSEIKIETLKDCLNRRIEPKRGKTRVFDVIFPEILTQSK